MPRQETSVLYSVAAIAVPCVLTAGCAGKRGPPSEARRIGSEGPRALIAATGEAKTTQEGTPVAITPFLADPANAQILGYGPTGKGQGSVGYFVIHVKEPAELLRGLPWTAQVTAEEIAEVVRLMIERGFLDLPDESAPGRQNYRLRVAGSAASVVKYCTREEFDRLLDGIADCDRLHRSVYRGDLAAVKAFVRFGQDVNRRAAFRYPFLSPARKIGGGEFGIGTNSMFWAKGDVPLRVALRSDRDGSHRQVVKYLLAQGGAAREDSRLVMYCVANNKLDYLDLLIGVGASVDGGWGSSKATPLHVAVRHDKRAVVRRLLRAKAKVDARTRDGDTPLMAAVREGNFECAKMLMDAGADVNAMNNAGSTPAMLAREKPEILKALLAHGADPNLRDPRADVPELRRKLETLKGKLAVTGVEAYIAALNELLTRYDHHPIVPSILLALGEIHEGSPERAIGYYARAAEYPIAGTWGFARQAALQRLARIYESRGEYRKAVETLGKWRISEPCGTGAAGSKVHKRFMLWRLRLNYEDRDAVYEEMWTAVPGFFLGEACLGGESLARFIRPVYPDAELPRLSREITRLAERHGEPKAETREERYRAREVGECLRTLRERLAFEQKVRNASPDGLIGLLGSVRGGNGHLQQYFMPSAAPYPSREKLLLDAIVRRGREMLPKLMALDRAASHPIATAAIGKIGGAEVVTYLSEKASVQTFWACAMDYYFALLLTEDEQARRLVVDAAEGDKNKNAKRALEAYSSSVVLTGIVSQGKTAQELGE